MSGEAESKVEGHIRELESKVEELEKVAQGVKDFAAAKNLRELLWNEWYKFMSEAKGSEGRKKVNMLFLKMTKEIGRVYEELEGKAEKRKEKPLDMLLRYLPPPLPFDPIGRAIYENLRKERETSGGMCQLCSMMSLEQFIDEQICNEAEDSDKCAVEALKVIYFFVAGIDKPESFEGKLKAVFERHRIDPNKMVRLKKLG